MFTSKYSRPRLNQPLLVPAVIRSIELKPVAAVSVLLYSGGEEIQVRGPIQISMPLGHNTHLQASDTVPAWAFNQNTGKLSLTYRRYWIPPRKKNLN